MKIIKERKTVTKPHYVKKYVYNDTPSAGFMFDCDENGNVFPFKEKAAEENYNECVAGTNGTYFAGVESYTNHYTEPAVGLCRCKEEVELRNEFCGACRCDKCGQWYNLQGSPILPPEQWEEVDDVF